MTQLSRNFATGVALVIGIGSMTGCFEKNKDLATDKDKASYVLGYQFGRNMKEQKVDIDQVALLMAIRDGLEGKESKVNQQDSQAAMMKLYEARQAAMSKEAEGTKADGKKWLEENKAKEGVKVTASGLQYKVITEGKGPKPKPESVVKVHYKGTFTDGKVFDSSLESGEPVKFPLNGVIPGWTEGLQLMPKGSKYMFYIPSELGYGDRGTPGIPPGSTLVFEVELLDVMKE